MRADVPVLRKGRGRGKLEAGIASRLISACLTVIVLGTLLVPAGSTSKDPSGEAALLSFISENEDLHMTVEDLAFFLVTHDFDATPKKDHVTVKIDGKTYRLAPNGDEPGLADIMAL